MTGLRVTVPIACFRKGMAREYLETEQIPPPATCYGFLLSLVGETDRTRHIGARVTVALVGKTATSVVLRTVWRVKSRPLGSPGNTRPDYQQLLTGFSADSPFVSLVIWLDSSGETTGAPTLEQRVAGALNPARRSSVDRFGGLSLGESTHLVDEVSLFKPAGEVQGQTFLLAHQGRFTLPVWVDHVGSRGTRYVTGDLVEGSLEAPQPAQMPEMLPPDDG